MSSVSEFQMKFNRWPDIKDLMRWESDIFRSQANAVADREIRARNLLDVDDARRVKFQRRVSDAWSSGIPQPIEWQGFLVCLGYQTSLSDVQQSECLHDTWEEVSTAVCSAEAVIGGVRGRIMKLSADLTTQILTLSSQFDGIVPMPSSPSAEERAQRLNDKWLELWKPLMRVIESQGLTKYPITGLNFTIPENEMLRLTSILSIFGEKKVVANDLLSIHPMDLDQETHAEQRTILGKVLTTLADFSEFFMTKYLIPSRVNNIALPGHDALTKLREVHRNITIWSTTECAVLLPAARSQDEMAIFSSFIANFLWLVAMAEGGATKPLRSVDWWYDRRGLLVLWMLRCNTLPDAHSLGLRRLPGTRSPRLDDSSTSSDSNASTVYELDDSSDETWTASQSQQPVSPPITPAKKRGSSSSTKSSSAKKEAKATKTKTRTTDRPARLVVDFGSDDSDGTDVMQETIPDVGSEPAMTGETDLQQMDTDSSAGPAGKVRCMDDLIPGMCELRELLKEAWEMDSYERADNLSVLQIDDDFAPHAVRATEWCGIRTFSGDALLMTPEAVAMRQERADTQAKKRDLHYRQSNSLTDQVLSAYTVMKLFEIME